MLPSLADLDSLLTSAGPAVLTTTRADGTPLTSPVWVRLDDGLFEIVVTARDGKLRNPRRDPRCLLVVFEASPPFRGVGVRAEAVIEEGDRAAEVRGSIARRYLGPEDGGRFGASRVDVPSVVVPMPVAAARGCDLSAIV